MIIDSHTHFYDPSRPQGIPWPDAKDRFLYRTVLPQHYKAVAVPAGVTGTVVVEASEWVEDNEWLLSLARPEPFIVGVVGNLEPGDPYFGRNLERFAKDPLFRGIRPRGKVMDQIESGKAVADLERLAATDLELDLLIQPKRLPDAVRLVGKLPGLRVVLNHVACVPIDGKAPDPAWVDGMRAMAALPNVYCKVSSLPSLTHKTPAPTDVAFYAPVLDAVWEAFGEDRVIYGSDWPVSGRFADYAITQKIAADYFSTKGAGASEKYFWKNSQAAYKWRKR